MMTIIEEVTTMKTVHMATTTVLFLILGAIIGAPWYYWICTIPMCIATAVQIGNR